MIVIVGGGISGLYMGYLLRLKGVEDFVIIERERVGGKIRDVKWKRQVIQEGAAVFHSNQKHIMGLIQRFKIKHHATPSTTHYAFDGAPVIDSRNHPVRFPPLTLSRDHSKRVRDVVPREYKLYDPAFDEYADMNYNRWLQSKRRVGVVYRATLSELVEAMREKLKKYIKRGEVTEIREKVVVVKKRSGAVVEIPYTKCVIATSRAESQHITTRSFPRLDARMRLAHALTRTCSSFRLFAHSKKLHGLEHPYVVSNHWFRFAIRLSDRDVMVSYVDNKRADDAHKRMKRPRRVKRELEEAFGFEIDDLHESYWEDAYTITEHDADERLLAKLHRLTPHVFQSFVPHVLDQAWLESHLMQIHKIFKEI